MNSRFCKYYRERKYVSYDSGVTWSPLNEYRKGELYETDSADCGYIVKYRWQVVSGYTCVGCTKYEKTQKFQSTDGGVTWTAVVPSEYSTGQVIEQGSVDCGCGTVYRWYQLPTTEYICIGYTKYFKEIYQVSYDNGQTWQNVEPQQTRASGIIEENSVDCGYGEPIERWVDGTMCDSCVPYKVTLASTGGTNANINVQCTTSTTLTNGEITTAIGNRDRNAFSSSTIGSCVNEIGELAFISMQGLLSVRIPSTVSSIGNGAFRKCVRLLDASIPDSVTSIGDYAFSGCTQLSNINLPNHLTSLGTNVFRDCLNFSTINIPKTLTYIPNACFYNCDGLSDIELPSSITSIGNEAFRDCSGLYNLVLHSTTPPTLGSNALYNVNSNLRIFVPSASVNTYKAASGWSSFANKIYPITN